MDFWYYLQLQHKKLGNNLDLKDMLDEDGKIQQDCEIFNEFRQHLPLAPDEFWQTIVNNILEYKKNQRFNLDDSLMQYILVLISWYTDEELSNPEGFNNSSGVNAALLASQFYFRLMNLVEFKYLKATIYENTFNCFEKCYEANQRNVNCLNFLKSLRQFLIHNEPNKKHLQVTLFQMCKVIENTSTKVYTDFSIENTSNLTIEALLGLKCLANQNWQTKAQFLINYALLHGIRTELGSEQMKKNFRNLILDLKHILKKDNYTNFQNAFLYIIQKSKYFDAVEASRLMLTLDEQFFKEVIPKLTTMGVSKEVNNKSNILRLLFNLLEHLPTNYYQPNKLEVFIHSVFNVLVLNCINNDEAISLVSKICLLNKNVISKQFEILLNSPTEYLYVENSLPTFCMKFNIHWSNRIRNRNIAVIILRIMCIKYNTSSDEHYAGILAMIANEADPSDMKMAIPLLLNLYITSKKKHSIHASEKVLDVMYSMAIHRSSGSTEFIKTLFHLMVEPNEDLMVIKSDFITTLASQILGDNKEFIQKANDLKLCDSNSIKKMINTIMNRDYDGLRITCAVVEKTPSPQGEKLIYHIMANLALLSEANYTGDLLFIVHSGIKYFVTYQRNINLTPAQQNNLSDFTKLLWDHMTKFLLPFNALGIGLNVLKTLAELRKETLNLDTLFQTVNFELKTVLLKLPEEIYTVPIMYSAELLSNKEYDVPEDIIKILETALDKISENVMRPDNCRNAKLHTRHYCCLVLMVRLAMKHSRLGPKAMNHLKMALRIAQEEFRMSLMDLMYDLCTYVVHNFDEFLYYSFNDLKSINFASRKQAATHIEHFVRLDYLKLSVEQFCKFISLLGDPLIEKSIQNLITNFVLTNQGVIEKYFLPLILHINFYSVHPMCPMSSQYMKDMNCIIRANFNKWKVFFTLFRSLPLRSRFLILKEICVSFFDKFVNGEIKIEDGIWNVINDAISIFKIMAYSSLDNVNYEEFYDKGMNEVNKYLIEKKSFSSDVPLKYPAMKDFIEKITYSLLHLLFYTESEIILQNYKLKLFEAILFWTHDLMPDMAAICITRKENTAQKISNYYQKLNSFYKKHKECLNITEYISEYNESNTFNLS